MIRLFGHDPADYRPHAVHGDDRTYRETNCYTDILVELLHARGDEPLAALGSTLSIAFEGDQWTFFKPDPADLWQLFGIDIHEMQPYLSLPAHIAEQLTTGRSMSVEVDAWYLPDTMTTSYRREHVKTSIVVEAIDTANEVLHYFHNASFFRLEGEDYRGALRVGAEGESSSLPPYCEIIRFDDRLRLSGRALRSRAADLMPGHLARRPQRNPFLAFGVRLGHDLPGLLAGDAQMYHDYAFATVRMAGAGFELCASYLDWLLEAEAAPASEALRSVVSGAKLLGFRLARRRQFDPAPIVGELAEGWDRAMTAIDELAAARR
jgi:hypothetical protein